MITTPRLPIRAPRADGYPDGTGDIIVLHVPDTEDNRPRVLDAGGRAWRRQIGFTPPSRPGKEPR